MRLGGGQNHRIGLYDMVLIKDNHIAAAGGIAAAVRRVRDRDPQQRPIEVEVTALAQLRRRCAAARPHPAGQHGPRRCAEAVGHAAGRVPLEARAE